MPEFDRVVVVANFFQLRRRSFSIFQRFKKVKKDAQSTVNQVNVSIVLT
jgi:hypothetical protein